MAAGSIARCSSCFNQPATHPTMAAPYRHCSHPHTLTPRLPLHTWSPTRQFLLCWGAHLLPFHGERHLPVQPGGPHPGGLHRAAGHCDRGGHHARGRAGEWRCHQGPELHQPPQHWCCRWEARQCKSCWAEGAGKPPMARSSSGPTIIPWSRTAASRTAAWGGRLLMSWSGGHHTHMTVYKHTGTAELIRAQDCVLRNVVMTSLLITSSSVCQQMLLFCVVCCRWLVPLNISGFRWILPAAAAGARAVPACRQGRGAAAPAQPHPSGVLPVPGGHRHGA